MAARIAESSATSPAPVAQAPATTGAWRPAVGRLHSGIASAALAGIAILALASPHVRETSLAWGGGLLLIGGALIGVPHGSSDFVVAYRLMRPRLGWRWLPCFLLLYLALVGATTAAWSIAPLVTLLVFLAISGLHFGSGEGQSAATLSGSGLVFAVRATTPILPIFLVHPAGVSGFIAALAEVPNESALRILESLRWPLLLPWAVALSAVTLPPLVAYARCARRSAHLKDHSARLPFSSRRATGAGWDGPAETCRSSDGARSIPLPATGKGEERRWGSRRTGTCDSHDQCAMEARDSIELLSISFAAAVLPPLLAFGLFFCLIHAVRHMAELAEDVFPRQGRSAALLVAAVVLPSAIACLVLLFATWSRFGGAFDAERLVIESLRMVAALTVPHMALETLARAQDRRQAAGSLLGR
ncbi:MAG: Brp/Blh family beta-carotene 15,15'-dioxygenase [Janthinobacterium lividum]